MAASASPCFKKQAPEGVRLGWADGKACDPIGTKFILFAYNCNQFMIPTSHAHAHALTHMHAHALTFTR